MIFADATARVQQSDDKRHDHQGSGGRDRVTND
jgi:hypothetical protein